MEEKHPQYINSIIRAVKILELYGKLNTQYLGIAEISNELKLQRTTTFNIVKTLLHEGWRRILRMENTVWERESYRFPLW